MSTSPSAHVRADELVALEDYRRDILTRVTPLEPIELALLEAHGSVLADDIVARVDVPGFANSAMDGYAVATKGLTEDAVLPVAAEAKAGSSPELTLEPGTAVRIMTGAPVPAGADAIVPVELVTEDGDRVTIHAVPEPGKFIRPAGQDVTAGTMVIESGSRLDAPAVGMLAAIGRDRVRVHPRPRVAILSTGDELVEPDVEPEPGRIRDANSYTLTAMSREAGARATRLPIVADQADALTDAIEGALSHADVVVTSGGVSAGRYDLVKQVLAQLGDVRFRKVAMQPGMPQAFGFLHPGGEHPVPCFGLPGNPVSAFVSFEIFVRPALRRLQGRTDLNRPRVPAVLEEPISSPAEKVGFARVRLRSDGGGWLARPTGPQGSGILRSVVEADGLAEVPVERTDMSVGETVVVHLLGGGL